MSLDFDFDHGEGIYTLQSLKNRNFGIVTGRMDFDASYPVGGESFIEVSRLFRDLRSVLINGKAPLFFEYDPDEDKVKATYGSGIHDYVIVDILGSEVTSAPNADEDTGPPNEAKIVGKITQTNLATALGVMTIAAQPDAPRNVGISIDNDSGGALDLYQGATTFRVVGTFLGAAQTEDIVLTSDAGNKSVANGKHRYIFGAKPFSTITSITQPDYATDAMAGNLKISVAPGSLLGLPFPIEATGDVIRVTVQGAAISLAGAVSVANQTVKVGDLVDNDDVSITFRSTGEVAEGTDLSGITGVSFVALGWI